MKRWKEYVISNKVLFFGIFYILVVLMGGLFIVCNYTIKETCQVILKWNFNIEWSYYWYGLFIVYWIEIILLMVIWDLFWFCFANVFNFFYGKLASNAVEKKNIWLLVKLVRVKYGFYKLYYYVRIGWISYSSNQKKGMIDFITNPTIFDLIKKTRSIIFMFPTILASILTVITYHKINIIEIEILKQEWNKDIPFLWENFTKISALVVLVLMVFLWYFVSGKGVVRRSIAQANRKKLEDIIQRHRQFSNLISNVIIKGSKNIEYIIRCRDLVLDYWMIKKYPYVSEKKLNKSLIVGRHFGGLDYFLVQEIPEINEIIKGFEELLLPQNESMSNYLSRYRYELLKFSIRIRSEKAEYFEEIMFTRSGLKQIVELENLEWDERIEFRIDNKEIQKDRKSFETCILNDHIINGVELLYELYRYILILNKILQVDSDKLGRALRMFTGKE